MFFIRCFVGGVVAIFIAANTPIVHAGCNIIPVAGQTFPSAASGVRSGSVSSPIAAPGATVRVNVNPACDGLPPGFAFAPTDVVKLTFLSPAPGNPTTTVDADNVMVDPGDPTGLTMRFTIPDTAATATGSPDGLAGPAEIRVERGVQVLARIGALYQPASGCDLAEENVFQHFTVLPKPNDVALQSTSPSRILVTVDGDGNILVPLDHTGGTVLPAGPGAPIARFLRGNSTYPAFDGGPNPTLSQALATALNVTVPQLTSEDLLRSFTIDGRPLPPLLRVDDSGDLFGTTDADHSVLRVRRLDGAGNPIYDFTTRLSNDGVGGPRVGPIVIDPAFTLTQCDPVPLRGLRSSTRVAAFVRDEFNETPLSNLNAASGDTDSNDSVVHIIGTAAGGQSCAINTGDAVSELSLPGFTEPVLETSDDLVAFAMSETDQNNHDFDGNGDTIGNILRVYDATGAKLTATEVAIDLSQRVNDRAVVISDPLVFTRTQPGGLGFNGTTPTDTGPFATTIAPDGRHVYVANATADSIDVFSRNLMSGVLSFVQNVTPIAGAPLRAIVANPRALSRHVYAVGQNATVNLRDYAYDGTTGMLSFQGSWNESGGPVAAPEELAVSPDGAHLYLADFNASRIIGFSLTADGALLTPPIAPFQVDDVNGVDGLAGTTGVTVSPDGLNVYGCGFNEDAVAVFRRDPATGVLTFLEAKFDGVDNVSGLSGPTEVVVSPDGKNVYATSTFVDALVVFERNQTTGALTYLQSVPNGAGEHMTISPDGRNVYVARTGANAVRVFSRNGANGTLGFVQNLQDGVGGVDGLASVAHVAVSPDDHHLYGTGFGDDAIALFGVSQGKLSVFDTDVASYRPEASVEATQAVVSGLRAGILTPEANVGSSLNGDADTDDLVAQAYDGGDPVPANRMRSLGVAADRIVISTDLVAVTVPESKQNQSPGGAAGNDLNGDGDVLDDVVFVQPLPVPSPATPQNLHVAADALGIMGSTIVIVTAESAEGPDGIDCLPTSPAGGCDLDGDGDANDRVLRFYQPSLPPPGFIEVRRPVEDFVIGGNLVAFRSSEAAMNATGSGCLPTSPPGGCDRNGDGDTLDAVMMIYDLASDALIDTGQTAIPCSYSIPGCDARVPYKIKGDNVCFLTSEVQQNTPPRDLNGDGLSNGIVLQCFNARSHKTQRFPLCDTTSTVEVFPGDFVDDTLLNVRVSETQLGYDVNGDNVLDDCVLFVIGDHDKDGSFDDKDTCVETPNATQVDSDLDGIGDVCDPHPFCDDFVPPAPPSPVAIPACQQAIGKAATGYLKQRAGAERSCLDKIGQGKLAGDADALCRGSLGADGEVPPSEPKTAANIAKAAAKFGVAVGKKCAADISTLDACATTTADLDVCVVPTYAATVNAQSLLAYGTAGAISDKATFACQRAVGSESGSYLTKVTQAMQQCLDKLNAGKISGAPQPTCLGSLTQSGVALPADPSTASKIQKAETSLAEKIAKSCGGSVLTALDVCGGVATTPASAGSCLACVGWRRSVEGLRSAYGPQP